MARRRPRQQNTKAHASKYIDKKNVSDRKAKIRDIRTRAKTARAKRKTKRDAAREACRGYKDKARQESTGKRPTRRRVMMADACLHCAQDVDQIERDAEKELDPILDELATHESEYLASAIATRHNRKREAERPKRSPAEERAHAIERVENELRHRMPGALAWFRGAASWAHAQWSAAAAKGLRKTFEEWALEYAQENPEVIAEAEIAAADKELARLEREQAAHAEREQAARGPKRSAAERTLTMLGLEAPPANPPPSAPIAEKTSGKKKGRSVQQTLSAGFSPLVADNPAQLRFASARRAPRAAVNVSEDRTDLRAQLAREEAYLAEARSINATLRKAKQEGGSDWRSVARKQLVALGLNQDRALALVPSGDLDRVVGVPAAYIENAQKSIAALREKLAADQAPARRAGPRTYAQAQAEILRGLQTRGWEIKSNLKVPHATRPDKRARFWFKPQAIYLSTSSITDLGKAHTTPIGDYRQRGADEVVSELLKIASKAADAADAATVGEGENLLLMYRVSLAPEVEAPDGQTIRQPSAEGKLWFPMHQVQVLFVHPTATRVFVTDGKAWGWVARDALAPLTWTRGDGPPEPPLRWKPSRLPAQHGDWALVPF